MIVLSYRTVNDDINTPRMCYGRVILLCVSLTQVALYLIQVTEKC